jgi:hypothetical protein
MKNLQWLIGLHESHESDKAHEIFIKNYRKIFDKEGHSEASSSRNSLIPSMILREKNQKVSKSVVSFNEPADTHDIKNYLEQIHGKKVESTDLLEKKNNMLKTLRRLVKKM